MCANNSGNNGELRFRNIDGKSGTVMSYCVQIILDMVIKVY